MVGVPFYRACRTPRRPWVPNVPQIGQVATGCPRRGLRWAIFRLRAEAVRPQRRPCALSHSSPSFPGSAGWDLPRLASDGPDVADDDIRPICFCGALTRGRLTRRFWSRWKPFLSGAGLRSLLRRKAFQWNAFVSGRPLSGAAAQEGLPVERGFERGRPRARALGARSGRWGAARGRLCPIGTASRPFVQHGRQETLGKRRTHDR